jgi:hypothetical protein
MLNVMLRLKKAGSLLEYVTLMGIIALALSAMQLYAKRSIQAVIKIASDEVGNQREAVLLEDYDQRIVVPPYSESYSTSYSESKKNITEGYIRYEKNDTSQQGGWSVSLERVERYER